MSASAPATSSERAASRIALVVAVAFFMETLPLVTARLLIAGMTRSMNFTAITTLAFADVPDEQRSGASALATMLQQVAITLGVAFAATALGASQALRGSGALALADFHHARFAVGALMAVAAAGMVRLHPQAGVAVTRRA